MAFNIPRGTADILPGQVELWQYIEAVAVHIGKRYNYAEIRTPIFEQTELFQRGVGETTDIVEKEMYTFQDKGDRSMTLRPEGTASVVRSYVENKMHGAPQQPVKLFYIGPMFRYERPQAGRTRQFTQFGIEAIGSKDPAIDAEVIALAMQFYKELGLKDLQLEINSVGCAQCRPKHRQALVEHLEGVKDQLGEEDRSRIDRNPLRVLDSKDPKTQELTQGAPSILDYLCADCQPHFEKVQDYLGHMHIDFQVNPRMVRGLDYYTQTAFEIKLKDMAANETICGGGRYNGLVQEIGGQDMPGIGFALSIERLMVALEKQNITLPIQRQIDCYLVSLGEKAKHKCVSIAQHMRASGLRVELDYLERGMKGQMKAANRLQAQYVIILGDEELAKNIVLLKEMSTGEQKELSAEEATRYILVQQTKEVD